MSNPRDVIAKSLYAEEWNGPVREERMDKYRERADGVVTALARAQFSIVDVNFHSWESARHAIVVTDEQAVLILRALERSDMSTTAKRIREQLPESFR